MDEPTFRRLAGYARIRATLGSRPTTTSYWAGFQRGIRRAFHGEAFGTEAEHEAWLGLAGSEDPSRDALGRGYRDGLEGKDRDGEEEHRA